MKKTLDIRKEEFLSYLDDDGHIVSGYFLIAEFTPTYIKIKTKGSYVILPMHRILKIKLKEDRK